MMTDAHPTSIPLDANALTYEQANLVTDECVDAFIALSTAVADTAHALSLAPLDQERDVAIVDLIDAWSDLERRAAAELGDTPDRRAALRAIDVHHKRGRELIDAMIDRFNDAPPAPTLTLVVNAFSRLVAMIEDRRSERIAELCGLAPATLH